MMDCKYIKKKTRVSSDQIISFFRFMRLFDVSLFSILHKDSTFIHAIVAWADGCNNGIPDIEEVQEVCWGINGDPYLEDALFIGEYAYDTGCIVSDKINIKKRELREKLGWSEERIECALKTLSQIKVHMIDDGEKNDSFFLHP